MPVEIARSRVKMVLALLGCVVFVAASLGIVAQGSAVTLVVGALGTVTFAGFGVAWVALLMRRGPGLVVDDAGFDDDSSAVAVGRVQWSDVTGVKEWGAFGSTQVVVLVNDPRAYLGRLSWFARGAARANLALVGSTVTIGSVGLRTNATALSLLPGQAHLRYHVEHEGERR